MNQKEIKVDTETETKYDPCRKFRKGDIVEPCEVKGRWFGAAWKVGERANLEGVDLCCTDLRNANLCNANLFRADLCGANLLGVDLKDAWLSGAKMDKETICKAKLTREQRKSIKVIG